MKWHVTGHRYTSHNVYIHIFFIIDGALLNFAMHFFV